MLHARTVLSRLALAVAILSAALALPAVADDAGFTPIFDGKSLEGWEGKDFWSVEDGAIVGRTTAEKPTNGNTFLVWRQGTLDDFELALTYRITVLAQASGRSTQAAWQAVWQPQAQLVRLR